MKFIEAVNVNTWSVVGNWAAVTSLLYSTLTFAVFFLPAVITSPVFGATPVSLHTTEYFVYTAWAALTPSTVASADNLASRLPAFTTSTVNS